MFDKCEVLNITDVCDCGWALKYVTGLHNRHIALKLTTPHSPFSYTRTRGTFCSDSGSVTMAGRAKQIEAPATKTQKHEADVRYAETGPRSAMPSRMICSHDPLPPTLLAYYRRDIIHMETSSNRTHLALRATPERDLPYPEPRHLMIHPKLARLVQETHCFMPSTKQQHARTKSDAGSQSAPCVFSSWT